MIDIQILDPVYSECSNIHSIISCLKYESVYWKQGPHSKKRVTASAYLCNHHSARSSGSFLTGLIPRIKDYCQRNNIEINIDKSKLETINLSNPSLPGISLREDQYARLAEIREKKRGIIKSPTGSGKTVMAGALISMMPAKAKILFVVHTVSLFSQSIEEMKKWFGEDVGQIGDKQFNPKRINVIIAQTANNILKTTADPRHNEFIGLLTDADAIIIDECHHITQETGIYGSLIKNCLAPIRIGFTATPLPEGEGKAALVCEGYLGPIIGEFSMSEGIEKGILAKPRIKLIPVPTNNSIAMINKYQDHTSYPSPESSRQDPVTVPGIKTAGIITNKQRNRLIAKEAKLQNDNGKSVLIMIQDIEHRHGEEIAEIGRAVYGIEMKIIQGKTDSQSREEIKKMLETKEAMTVISTSVWREGINIRSLDCVINACGGKAEIMTLQAIGRGLRTTDTKKELLIVDLLDPYKYLAQHTIERLKIYVENGWL